MKHVAESIRMLVLIILAAQATGQAFVLGSSGSNSLYTGAQNDPGIPRGCSVFTIAKDGQVFFGGNDDYINPDSYYWVDPGEGENYGVIWIGQPDNVQQGVNEHGLAYDANGLPRVDVNPHDERAPVYGDYTIYPVRIMHECATVEEVIAWVNTHRWHTFMHDQMQFADTTGDAVIISAGKDGEVVYTRKDRGDGFLVSTNFNVANPANGYGYPCWRYDLATELLGGLVDREKPIEVEDIAGVLDAVHQETVNSWTLEAMAADLTNGLIYLYYFYQYDRPVILNVKEELANPRAAGPLSSLFPQDVQSEANYRYQQLVDSGKNCSRIGMAWLAAMLISLALYFIFSRGKAKGMGFWLPSIVFIGPLALLAWFLAGRKEKPGIWRRALVEVIGDLTPTVIALIAFLLIIILSLQGITSWPFQVALLLGLPLLLGWLVFPHLLLTPKSPQKTWQFLGRRLPHAMVAMNLGMAGIFTVGLILINMSIRICPIMQISPWTLVTWLAVIAPGALLGGCLLFVYEYVNIKNGFMAWSAISREGEEVSSKSWRKLWWWVLLSLVVLLAGIKAGASLQGLLFN